MIKYYNAMVVFEELPSEIALAINITNCPCHCKGCHSQFLWEDIGTPLTKSELDELIDKNNGITCVCLMGGDREPNMINRFAAYIKDSKKLKVGWYSGKDDLPSEIKLDNFDYIKIGHYDEELGGLNKRTTNQRLYKVNNDKLEDITEVFWKKS